ncbi:MAG: PDZ domain-containing protein [Gammaproteobacteria bacterium]|nr:PDZ domain-containing protein [Gammaproteobacteria bacterium]
MSPEIAALQQQLQEQKAEADRLRSQLAQLQQDRQQPTATADTSSGNVAQLTSANDDAREVLKQLGLSSTERQSIKNQIDASQLAHLNLRNQAMREKWYGTERFYNAMRQLPSEYSIYRSLLGDDKFDRFLFLSDHPNRVGVRSIMAGSTAAQHGLLEGDVIVSYAEKRIFDWNELSHATTEGKLGEQVRVELQRDDEMMDVYLPRGPLGITLIPISQAP